MDEFVVFGPDGNEICYLSSRLAERQRISVNQLGALKLSHQLKHMIFECAKHDTVKNDPIKLQMLAAVFDALENEQQKLWNFVPRANMHRWFDFPGCTCPKMDNADRLGTDFKIISEDCPIHHV